MRSAYPKRTRAKCLSGESAPTHEVALRSATVSWTAWDQDRFVSW